MQQIMERREDLLDWIHVYLGYCLTGHTNEQLFPIWWGSGANGKSQLLSIVGGILGNYCKPVSSETFLQNHSGSPVRDDLAILKGARFIWASEPDAGKVLSMSTVKLMTGSDPITCRHLYGRIFSYIPTYKPVFVTNHRPQVKSQDYGTWRRLRFIPFTYQVPTEDRIPDLALRLLEEEGDRILGWLLEGARRWYEEAKLPYCHDIEAATDGLRVGDDPLAEFIMERCIVDYSLVTPLDNVWREYTAWANEKNIRNVLSRTLLRHLLEERPSTMISTYSMKVMVKGLAIKAKME
jgi:putative DNA primase/helicase